MTPEQEEQVRRALRAAAQADEPARMPPEVANRLDDVLAELAGTKEHVGSAPDESSEPRRRRWPNALVAAAAVAVIAVAGAAVATRGFGSLGGGGDSTSAESSTGAKSAAVTPSAAPSTGGLHSLHSGSVPAGGAASLHSSRLAADVSRLLRAGRAFGGAKAPRTTNDLPVACARPFTGRGASLFVVRLDGRPATLVVGPARDGRREARVYSCAGAGSPLASVSVPAR